MSHSRLNSRSYVRIRYTDIFLRIEEEEQSLSSGALQALMHQLDVFASHYKFIRYSNYGYGYIKIEDTIVHSWGRGASDNGTTSPLLIEFAMSLKKFLDSKNQADRKCNIVLPTDSDFDSVIVSWEADTDRYIHVVEEENNSERSLIPMVSVGALNCIGALSAVGTTFYGIAYAAHKDDVPVLPLIVMGSTSAGICALNLLYCLGAVAVEKVKHCIEDYRPTLFKPRASAKEEASDLALTEIKCEQPRLSS